MKHKPIKENEKVIRRDTIRITPTYEKIIEKIKKNESIKQNTDAWRIALESYEKNQELIKKIEELSGRINTFETSIEDLNFLIRTMISKYSEEK